jgi:hypothetical protein
MYGINTQKLPRLRSWADASHHELHTTPIRGRTVKPLGDRREHSSKKIERRGDDTIVCVLYNTDVVTYFKDGRIKLYAGGYHTQSTVAFMSRLTDIQVSLRDNNMVASINGGAWIIPSGGLMLKAGAHDPTNPEPCRVHSINRKEAKRVRQIYADFTTRVVAMCKLVGDAAEGGYVGHLVLPREIPADQGELVREAVSASALCSYDYASRGYKYTASPERARRQIEHRALMLYRDTVFTSVTLPPGEYKKDAYAKYFN